MVSKREERWKIFNARFETFFLSCWLSLNLKRGGEAQKTTRAAIDQEEESSGRRRCRYRGEEINLNGETSRRFIGGS